MSNPMHRIYEGSHISARWPKTGDSPQLCHPLEPRTKAPFLDYLPRRVHLSSYPTLGYETAAQGVRLLNHWQAGSLIGETPVAHCRIVRNRVFTLAAAFSVCWSK